MALILALSPTSADNNHYVKLDINFGKGRPNWAF